MALSKCCRLLSLDPYPHLPKISVELLIVSHRLHLFILYRDRARWNEEIALGSRLPALN